ncbi:MAG: thioesterase family protein [Novosphingobium sp.]|nr:thioesterase family protein [Novosphingobium sp.]
MNCSEVLARAEPLEGGFRVAVPEDWHQGRTAYGGFSAALALSAAIRTGGHELPPLRSAQISFIGPLFGEVEVRARLMRSGRNATWISSEISRDGQPGLAASFVFMGPVESELHLNEQQAPESLIAVEEAQPLRFGEHSPVYLSNHFDVRFALPRSEEKRPELCWWVRARERDGLDPMTEILLIADALPPGVMPLLPPQVPVSSMTWQCNLLTPSPRTHGGWWLLRSTGDYSENGCSSQRMAIWNANGQPVTMGMQSVAVFG